MVCNSLIRVSSYVHAVIVCTGYDDMSYAKNPGQIGTELERRAYAFNTPYTARGPGRKTFCYMGHRTSAWPSRIDAYMARLQSRYLPRLP